MCQVFRCQVSTSPIPCRRGDVDYQWKILGFGSQIDFWSKNLYLI